MTEDARRRPTAAVDDQPPWLRAALATPAATRSVVVDGCTVVHRCWPAATTPGTRDALVLVHGGAAHARWWDHVAPLLTETWDVRAIDLSGHGDSGHRGGYAFATWVDEVVAAARAAGGAVVVGHSLGGVVAGMMAARGDAAVAGAVVIDAPLSVPEGVDKAEATFSRSRAYGSRDAAEGRFRLLPPQPVVHPSLLAHVARTSVHETPDGWTWKFDAAVFPTTGSDRPQDFAATLEAARCPIAAVVGGVSPIVSAPERDRLRQVTDPSRPLGRGYVEVVDGHHHLMFDRPRELAGIIDRLALACLAPPADAGAGPSGAGDID